MQNRVGILVALSATVRAAMSIDTTSNSAVIAAVKAAMPMLKLFYGNNNLFYAYYSYTGDSQYNDFVDGQMQLAVGTDDGFLDATTALTGRWNDDIGWWALSVMTAAETTPTGILAPSNILAGYNPTYVSIVNTTYYQMWEDWDSACNGGIYWARDRSSSSSNTKYYKSSITNAQHIELSARLYALTGNSVYLNNAKQVYSWMLGTVIDSSTYAVYDGIDTSTCTVSSEMFSYHSGELMAGLSILYKTTKDTSFLNEAHKHWARVYSYFTENSVLYDPGVTESPSGYLWGVYKGIADLYSVTTDSSVQSQIVQLTRFEGTDHTLSNGTNVRDQFETVAILNSLAIITGATVVTHTQAVASPSTSTTSSGSNNTLIYAGIGGGVGAFVLISLVAFVIIMRRRARKAEESQRNVSAEIYGDSMRQKDYAMQTRGGGVAASVGGKNNYNNYPTSGQGVRAGDNRLAPQQGYPQQQNYSQQQQYRGQSQSRTRENNTGNPGRGGNGGYAGRF
ncbi:hydrolase 76 protein [Entophlyctis sp. JEL0112]|nr:hydrolase 76 protein [Entophlyctis sp. JEL0112]